jgi:hypothetical protein
MRSCKVVQPYLLMAVLSVAAAAPLAAQPLKIAFVADPVLGDLRLLSREAGKSLLSLTPPLSSAEIPTYSPNIDADSLSPSGLAASAGCSLPAPSGGPRRWRSGLRPAPDRGPGGASQVQPDAGWTAEESGSASPSSSPGVRFAIPLRRRDLEIPTDPTYYDGDGHWA